MLQDNSIKNMNTVPMQSNSDTAKNKNMKTVLVASLNSHPRNQEFFDDMYGEEWESFKAHIAAHGIRSAITIGKDGTITSGHQRVRACKELGITEIPALIIDYASDDEMLLDLISTNLKQRGVGNLNPFKLGACIKELERIYGIQHGGNHGNQYKVAKGPMDLLPNQKALADEFKIELNKWKRCKQMADMIPELQALVTNETITARTALDIARKLPEEEQRKLISGLDPDSKYTAKQINAEIAALKTEKERLASVIEEKDAQLEAKNSQIEADRQKYNDFLKQRDEKFNRERDKLNKELKSKDVEIERLYANPPKPADYDSTKKQNVLLQDKIEILNDRMRQLQSQVDAYNGQAQKYTEASEEYKKILKQRDEAMKELEQLKFESSAQFELAKLTVVVRDFLRNKLAPIKFLECFKSISTNPVVGDDLIDIIDMTEKWCAEMRNVTRNIEYHGGKSGEYVDVEIVDGDIE